MHRRDAIDPTQRRILVWAVGLSVVIHALLVLLSLWFPIGSGAAIVLAADDPEESILHFAFAERDTDPTTDDPEQDSRFTPLDPQPGPEDPLPVPAAAAVSQVSPPDPDSLEQREAARSESPAEVQQGVAATPTEPAAVPPDVRGRTPAPGADLAPSPRDSHFSMEQALRDFGDALDRPRSAPRGSPGQRTNRNVVVADLSQIPVTGFGVGNLEFESRDYDWNEYGRQIYTAIWRAWHNRLWMTTDNFESWASRNGVWRLNHSTRVHFVIERNGEVTGIYEEEGSVCEPFDAASLEALEEVILPPLPGDFPRDREVVHGRFMGRGPIRAMAPTLRRMKRLGYF